MKTSKEFNLYQLTGIIERLDEKLEAEIINKSGEIVELSPEDSELINLVISDKIDSCVGYYQYLGDHAKTLKERADAFSKAAKIAERKAESLKNYIELCMARSGKEELKGETTVIKWRKIPASCEIVDNDKLPSKYIEIKQEVTISKKKILDDLKAGIDVLGAKLIDDKKTITFKVQ